MSAAEDARHVYEQVEASMRASDGLMDRVAADVERIVRQSITVVSSSSSSYQLAILPGLRLMASTPATRYRSASIA